ncbi:NAD(P)H-dependent oxidoreductase [Stappia sp. BW2]|uniref:NADPH-dependent FMN reductase n=1 Tax=Stappia sp. BW2 TaxID=2592622 RepID=UPI0011DE7591|nr:NADPH-dependent FMN reductase [Stappia sp. BW2]TYC64936.1 NAD(P)H-dependent oxidoreductase [Stappia sp. BW2]
MPLKILTFCGSLRAASSNLALLNAAERLVPEGLVLSRYDRIGELPHFVPDLDVTDSLPEIVADLRAQVARADGLLFAVPEYMHALPGSFKNALDWMVGCQKFPGKPVALAHVTSRHAFAPPQLEEILRTMSAEIVSEAGFSLGLTSNAITAETICDDARLATIVTQHLDRYRSWLYRQHGAD